MIHLEVIDPNTHQFCIQGDQPYRTVTTLTEKGHLIVFVYPGSVPDTEQEPIGAYDSSLPTSEIISWTWDPAEEGA